MLIKVFVALYVAMLDILKYQDDLVARRKKNILRALHLMKILTLIFYTPEVPRQLLGRKLPNGTALKLSGLAAMCFRPRMGCRLD